MMKRIGNYLLVLLTLFTLVTPYASALEVENVNEPKAVAAANKEEKKKAKEEEKAEKEKDKEDKKEAKEKEKKEKKEEKKPGEPAKPEKPTPPAPPAEPTKPVEHPKPEEPKHEVKPEEPKPEVKPNEPGPVSPVETANKEFTITVKYVDNNNKEIGKTTTIKAKKGEIYVVNAEEIAGYKLMSEKSTVTGTAEKDETVTFEYNPVANLFIRIDAKIQYENGTTGYPESEYLYVGSTSVTGKIVYDINADKTTDLSAILSLSDKVENEVTTIITDKEVIAYLNKTYKADLTEDDDIVWYVLKEQKTNNKNMTYKDSEGNNVKIETPECLFHIDGVVYKKGKVTTKYVDEDGKVLAKDKVDTYYYGEKYTTSAETFEDYELIETKGNESGKVETRETTVTYIYQFVMGQGDDEPTEELIEEPIVVPEEPAVVQTGSEVDYSLMTSAFITASLMALAIYSKKKKNN